MSLNPNLYEVSGREPLRFGFEKRLNIDEVKAFLMSVANQKCLQLARGLLRAYGEVLGVVVGAPKLDGIPRCA